MGRDDRFGYIEIPSKGSLRDRVRFHADVPGRVQIDVSIAFELVTGEVGAWSVDQLTDPSWREYRRPGEPARPPSGFQHGSPVNRA